jgi:hypothetical protein
MPFLTDPRVPAADGGVFGEYLITFISENGQVRAEIFRRGKAVVAHVWFPTGLDAGSVADHYYSDLLNYAREQGFADPFKLVYS